MYLLNILYISPLCWRCQTVEMSHGRQVLKVYYSSWSQRAVRHWPELPAMGGSQLTFGWVETTNQFSAILLLVVSCKPLWSPCNHHQSFFSLPQLNGKCKDSKKQPATGNTTWHFQVVLILGHFRAEENPVAWLSRKATARLESAIRDSTVQILNGNVLGG